MSTLFIITGSTGIGKSALAVQVAKHFNSAVVSADSRQVYREMKIGTARPDSAEMMGIPHYLLGHKSIHEPYTVADYEQEALEVLENIFSKDQTAVLCGGTGLYIRALTQGLDELPEIDPALRHALREQYVRDGIQFLQNYLEEYDPESYKTIDLQNPHRLLRAVETHKFGGKSISALKTGKKKARPFDIIKIGLTLPMPELYEQINQRTDRMMELGLLEEARALLPWKHLQALQTVGYTELFDHFEGKCGLDDAIALIKQHSRQYAKRQMTWLRKEENIHWFAPEQEEEIICFLEKVS